MAEARSMRRCLSRAFPVGLSSFEDIQEQKALEYTQDATLTDSPQAPENPLATKIAECDNMVALEALKPEITKSKSNDMVKAFAQKQKELKQTTVDEFIAQKQKEPETVGPDFLKEAKEKLEK